MVLVMGSKEMTPRRSQVKSNFGRRVVGTGVFCLPDCYEDVRMYRRIIKLTNLYGFDMPVLSIWKQRGLELLKQSYKFSHSNSQKIAQK